MSRFTQVKTLPIGMYLTVDLYANTIDVLTHAVETNIDNLEKESSVDFFLLDEDDESVSGFILSEGITETEIYQLIALPINNQIKVKKFLKELQDEPTHVVVTDTHNDEITVEKFDPEELLDFECDDYVIMCRGKAIHIFKWEDDELELQQKMYLCKLPEVNKVT